MENDTRHTQYSGSISESKIDLLEDRQILSSDNASPMSEVCVGCKENEVEPAISSEAKDKAESLSSPSSKCVTTMSKHQCSSETDNAGFSADSEGNKLEINAEPIESTSAKKLKMQGVSLTDFFTPEEIKQHMGSLKQSIYQLGLMFDTSSPVKVGLFLSSFSSIGFFCLRIGLRFPSDEGLAFFVSSERFPALYNGYYRLAANLASQRDKEHPLGLWRRSPLRAGKVLLENLEYDFGVSIKPAIPGLLPTSENTQGSLQRS